MTINKHIFIISLIAYVGQALPAEPARKIYSPGVYEDSKFASNSPAVSSKLVINTLKQELETLTPKSPAADKDFYYSYLCYKQSTLPWEAALKPASTIAVPKEKLKGFLAAVAYLEAQEKDNHLKEVSYKAYRELSEKLIEQLRQQNQQQYAQINNVNAQKADIAKQLKDQIQAQSEHIQRLEIQNRQLHAELQAQQPGAEVQIEGMPNVPGGVK
ncbi:MAG: hypothetical protein P4L31_07045 [Candidatus Babeliales bacterium]|nr:hypothetical protein [Candidatus Babeliales bacterium]